MNINGDIVQWDARTHQKIKIVSYHTKTISDLQHNADRTLFISASMEGTTVFAGCDKPFAHRMGTIKRLAIEGFVALVRGWRPA